MYIAIKEALFLVSCNVCMHSQAGAWEREKDIDFSFDDLGISFSTPVPLSQLEFTTSFMDERVESMKAELGDDFEAMVTYLQKMETPLV